MSDVAALAIHLQAHLSRLLEQVNLAETSQMGRRQVAEMRMSTLRQTQGSDGKICEGMRLIVLMMKKEPKRPEGCQGCETKASGWESWAPRRSFFHSVTVNFG